MRTFRPILVGCALLTVAPSSAWAGEPTQPASHQQMSVQEQEVESHHLPSWAQEEWDASQAARPDPIESARALPPPPDGISRARGQDVSMAQAPAAPAGTTVQSVPSSEQARPGVGFGDFYSGLSPYGTWVETPEYGYVFIPSRQTQVRDWRPYLYGRWIWTSYGWTWVSEEPFGWATYHYGRWTVVPGWGWAWVPGYTWGPAWVVWRFGDDAVGWSPLLPGYVAWTTGYPIYYDQWIFVGPRYFYSYPVYRHHYHWQDSRRWYRSTHWASHWHGHDRRGYVYSGPPRSYVERRAGVAVRPTRIDNARRPDRATVIRGDRPPSSVSLYRPDAAGAQRPQAFLPKGSQGAIPRNERVPHGVGSGLVARPGAGQSLQATPRSEQRVAPGQGVRVPEARVPGRGPTGGPQPSPRAGQPGLQQPATTRPGAAGLREPPQLSRPNGAAGQTGRPPQVNQGAIPSARPTQPLAPPQARSAPSATQAGPIPSVRPAPQATPLGARPSAPAQRQMAAPPSAPSQRAMPAPAAPSQRAMPAPAAPSQRAMPAPAAPSQRAMPAPAAPSQRAMPAPAAPSQRAVPAPSAPSQRAAPPAARPSGPAHGR